MAFGAGVIVFAGGSFDICNSGAVLLSRERGFHRKRCLKDAFRSFAVLSICVIRYVDEPRTSKTEREEHQPKASSDA
jgi:hypothetical protein